MGVSLGGGVAAGVGSGLVVCAGSTDGSTETDGDGEAVVGSTAATGAASVSMRAAATKVATWRRIRISPARMSFAEPRATPLEGGTRSPQYPLLRNFDQGARRSGSRMAHQS